MTHKTGNTYLLHASETSPFVNDIYTLTQIKKNRVCLVNKGNRWLDPIKVRKVYNITNEEFAAISASEIGDYFNKTIDLPNPIRFIPFKTAVYTFRASDDLTSCVFKYKNKIRCGLSRRADIDTPDKIVGEKQALRLVIDQFKFNKKMRTLIWKHYLECRQINL